MANFQGVPYPVRRHPQGLFHIQSGVNQIKSDLLILLLTNPGERVFLPTFGTPLRRLVFEQNDISLQETARQMIINSIKTWEPRIVVQQIEVTNTISSADLNSNDDKSELDNILSIKIVFVDPQQLTEVQELKLEIPLSE